MHVIALTTLGWDDKTFWKATPKKYHACLVSFGEINKIEKEEAQPLLGSDAIKDAIGSLKGLV